MTTKAKQKTLVVLFFLAVTGFAFFYPATLGAKGVDDVQGGITTIAGAVGLAVGGTQSPITIIGGVVKALLGFLGVVFLLLVIYAGLKWMLSMGEAKKVESARKIIVHASVGIAVIVLSYAIVSFVLFLLSTGTG